MRRFAVAFIVLGLLATSAVAAEEPQPPAKSLYERLGGAYAIATVVDAFSNGFATIVVGDAVFDRGELSHAVNLFDMDQKYADVIGTEETIAYLTSLGDRPGDPTP